MSITYGYRPTIDEKLASAERRLLRLQQMETDARIVLRRRHQEFLSVAQSLYETSPNELDKSERRYIAAGNRLTQVQTELMLQTTKVRHLREGLE